MKRTRIFSIIFCHCPACEQGNLFSNKTIFPLREMLEMPSKCSVCRQDFEIEPGFYLGALWVSYPIVLILFLSCLIGLLVVFDNILISLILASIFLGILTPFILRISRSIWIHIFV